MTQQEEAATYARSLAFMVPSASFAAKRLTELLEEACDGERSDGTLDPTEIGKYLALVAQLRDFLDALARVEASRR